jgi:hypothetical protein
MIEADLHEQTLEARASCSTGTTLSLIFIDHQDTFA